MKHLILLIIVLIVAIGPRSLTVSAQGSGWSYPFEVSGTTSSSWFPDLAVGPYGSVHIVWASGIPVDEAKGIGADLLMYRDLKDGRWSETTAIANPNTSTSSYAIRNSITMGLDGRLHIIVRGPRTMEHMSAPWANANSVQDWVLSRNLASGLPYYGNIVVDLTGALHVTWNSTGANPDCPECQDIYYRRSSDGGANWGPPVQLSAGFNDAIKPQMKIDSFGGIHVVWEERGQLSSDGYTAIAGMYRRSLDGGLSWEEATSIVLPPDSARRPPQQSARNTPTPPETPPAPMQMTLGLTGQSDLIIVFRTNRSDEQIYYVTSRNRGETWMPPAAVPQVRPRRLDDTPFDAYTMVTDGSGSVHLIMVGRLLQGEFQRTNPRLLHLIWNGATWSRPAAITTDDRYPEWPRAVMNEDKLHLTWFTRNADDRYGGGDSGVPMRYQVWYSHRTISGRPLVSAPQIAPTPTLEPSSTPPPVFPSPTPTVNPAAIAAPPMSGPPAWESQGVNTIAVALAPLLTIGAFVFAIRVAVRKRR